MPDVRMVEAAKAALHEVGRPDLAVLVTSNSVGMPGIDASQYRTADQATVTKAFAIAHTIIHPEAHVVVDGGIAVGGFHCRSCWDRMLATQPNVGPFQRCDAC